MRARSILEATIASLEAGMSAEEAAAALTSAGVRARRVPHPEGDSIWVLPLRMYLYVDRGVAVLAPAIRMTVAERLLEASPLTDDERFEALTLSLDQGISSEEASRLIKMAR